MGSEEGDDGDEGDEVAILFLGLPPPPSSSAEDFVLFIHKNGVCSLVSFTHYYCGYFTHTDHLSNLAAVAAAGSDAMANLTIGVRAAQQANRSKSEATKSRQALY